MSKEIIQTLHVNDHYCVFLMNQQANEGNNRLSTEVSKSRLPVPKCTPKRKK